MTRFHVIISLALALTSSTFVGAQSTKTLLGSSEFGPVSALATPGSDVKLRIESRDLELSLPSEKLYSFQDLGPYWLLAGRSASSSAIYAVLPLEAGLFVVSSVAWPGAQLASASYAEAEQTLFVIDDATDSVLLQPWVAGSPLPAPTGAVTIADATSIPILAEPDYVLWRQDSALGITRYDAPLWNIALVNGAWSVVPLGFDKRQVPASWYVANSWSVDSTASLCVETRGVSGLHDWALHASGLTQPLMTGTHDGSGGPSCVGAPPLFDALPGWPCVLSGEGLIDEPIRAQIHVGGPTTTNSIAWGADLVVRSHWFCEGSPSFVPRARLVRGGDLSNAHFVKTYLTFAVRTSANYPVVVENGVTVLDSPGFLEATAEFPAGVAELEIRTAFPTPAPDSGLAGTTVLFQFIVDTGGDVMVSSIRGTCLLPAGLNPALPYLQANASQSMAGAASNSGPSSTEPTPPLVSAEVTALGDAWIQARSTSALDAIEAFDQARSRACRID